MKVHVGGDEQGFRRFVVFPKRIFHPKVGTFVCSRTLKKLNISYLHTVPCLFFIDLKDADFFSASKSHGEVLINKLVKNKCGERNKNKIGVSCYFLDQIFLEGFINNVFIQAIVNFSSV